MYVCVRICSRVCVTCMCLQKNCTELRYNVQGHYFPLHMFRKGRNLVRNRMR